MNFLDIRTPTSFRLSMPQMDVAADPASAMAYSPFIIFKKKTHDAHPSLDHLVLLVFEAVMEVVCVSLPGYIIARLGHFDSDKQKFLANLNVMLFTPCLIFTKLASQLNADKLVELGVIPVIFVIQTLVSYLVSVLVSKCFRFNRRASNFVTAMGVFGNSNSLPISLVISLSQTLKGLHWDKIPGDNDDEVAARGILYLMIFQQLGQLVRWSWGYHVLLAPKEKYEEYDNDNAEEGRFRGEHIQDETETERLMQGLIEAGNEPRTLHHERSPTQYSDQDVYEPAGPTPVAGTSQASPNESDTEENEPTKRHVRGSLRGLPKDMNSAIPSEPSNGHPNGNHLLANPDGAQDIVYSFPPPPNHDDTQAPTGVKGLRVRSKMFVSRQRNRVVNKYRQICSRMYATLPAPLQKVVLGLGWLSHKVSNFIWEFMNPPLWAMLIAVFVASVPDLQKLFFQEGSFVKNSVTAAVKSSAGVAVPLILVVLGANLARNTQKRDEDGMIADREEQEIGTKLLVASLVCRMLLPTLIMAPILAVFAKYVPVSILDDPIFIIVCFLLTGAPSALQLAQICQINGVYENVMSRILFQSYVVWILPSTLILVMCALETVEWASQPL